MPLDVCPGAQHLRAQLEEAARRLPSARLEMLALSAYAQRAQQGRRPYGDRVVRALEAMALVEREREEAPAESEAAFLDVDELERFTDDDCDDEHALADLHDEGDATPDAPTF